MKPPAVGADGDAAATAIEAVIATVTAMMTVAGAATTAGMIVAATIPADATGPAYRADRGVTTPAIGPNTPPVAVAAWANVPPLAADRQATTAMADAPAFPVDQGATVPVIAPNTRNAACKRAIRLPRHPVKARPTSDALPRPHR